MADRELAGERAQVVLAEGLADEAQLAPRDDVPAAVRRRDPRGLLPAVLQRVEPVEGEPRGIVAGRVEPEDPAFLARVIGVVALAGTGSSTGFGASGA